MTGRALKRIKGADKNTKIVITNAVSAFAIKGGALVVTLLITPAYIRFFNNSQALGVWYTLLSVITWVLNFDLGIGNGLRNKLTESLAQENDSMARKYISSAYVSVGFVVAAGLLICQAVSGKIQWNQVFNIEEGIVSAEALSTTVRIFLCGILVQLFLKLITSILYAIQLSFVNNALSLITAVIMLIYVHIAKSGTNDENIVNMAIVHTAAVLIPLVITTVIVFCTRLKDAKPSFRYYEFRYAKEILGLGGIFFIIQLAYMFIMNTNEYFILYLTDSSYVVDYQIYFKLFTLIGTLATLALTPVWSAITKAFSEKKYHWITGLYRKMMLLSLVSFLFNFVFLLFIQTAVNIWLGEKAITVNYFYAFVFAMMGGCIVFNGVMSSFANGIGRLTPQAVCFGTGALLKIPMAILLVKMTKSWIGVILTVDIIMIIFIIVQAAANQKTIKEWKQRNAGTQNQVSIV